MTIEREFEIKTVSEANFREHFMTKHRRKKQQQEDFVLLWRAARITVTPPAVITFTRISVNRMDNDNLAGAFKHIRDALAREIGIDDGDPSIEWRYRQEQVGKRTNKFRLTIEYPNSSSHPVFSTKGKRWI